MQMGHVKNWAEFQHYKDRSPPWIKLHRGLLDNIDYALMEPLAAKCLPLVWLLASEYDGKLPELEVLAFRLRLDAATTQGVVDELIKRRFVESGSSEQVATPAQPKSNPSRYVPDKIRFEVMQRDGGACVWCQSSENVEFDHITPVSKGGKSTACNLQLLCRSCNRKKRNRESEQAEQVATQVKKLRSLETETETEVEKEKEIGLFPGIDPKVVADFKALRKAKKSPITPTAVAGIQREANKAGLTLESVLAMCCERGWAGFNASWLANRGEAPAIQKTRKAL